MNMDQPDYYKQPPLPQGLQPGRHPPPPDIGFQTDNINTGLCRIADVVSAAINELTALENRLLGPIPETNTVDSIKQSPPVAMMDRLTYSIDGILRQGRELERVVVRLSKI
jgi:hypothetical protein